MVLRYHASAQVDDREARHRAGFLFSVVWYWQTLGPQAHHLNLSAGVCCPSGLQLTAYRFQEKRALVETLSWFLAGTVGLVRTYLAADMEDVRSGDQLDLADSLAYLTPEQRALIAETSPWVGAVDPDAILEAGFRALIDGVVKARAAL